MAQRPEPTGISRARQRGKPVQVQIKQSRQWGLILGSLVLALGLIGILGFAVTNQGAGFEDPLEKLDRSVEGVQVAKAAPSQDHKDGPLTYSTKPSSGGEHNSTWQNCTGSVYRQEVAEENATHSMEHGAVWVTYQPTLPADQVSLLAQLVEGENYRLLSPMPGQENLISVQAWGRQLTAKSASDSRIEEFLDGYTNGPQTPEKGASCASRLQVATGPNPEGGAPAPAGGAPVAPAPVATAAG